MTKLKHYQIFLVFFICQVGVLSLPIIFRVENSYLQRLTLMLIFQFPFIAMSLYSHTILKMFEKARMIQYIGLFIIGFVFISPFYSTNILFKLFRAILGLSFFGSYIYILKVVAKSLVSHEKKSDVKFTDYGLEMFLLAFFPIGITILQPRINKVATSIN